MKFNVLTRQARKGDEVLIRDEIVFVTGIEADRFGHIDQVIVERDGESYSISPFETPVEVIEWA